MESSIEIIGGPSRWELSDLSRTLAPSLRSIGAERAIAFGSYARGTPDAFSDLDLVVVLESDLPPTERGDLVLDVVLACPIGLDVLVLTPGELDEGLRRGLGLFHDLALEGVDVFP